MKSDPSQATPFIAFINQRTLAVLSTASDNLPWGAPVHLLSEPTDRGFSCFFITRSETRKTRNILANPAVALTMVGDRILETLQMTGLASVVSDAGRADEILGRINETLGERIKTIAPPSNLVAGVVCVIEVAIDYARLSDYSNAPIRREISLSGASK